MLLVGVRLELGGFIYRLKLGGFDYPLGGVRFGRLGQLVGGVRFVAGGIVDGAVYPTAPNTTERNSPTFGFNLHVQYIVR